MAVIGAILALGLLIVVHEAGHYFVARWCRMRVDRFSIGFGPALLRWRRREPVAHTSLGQVEEVVDQLIDYARREPNSFVGVVPSGSGDKLVKKAKDRVEYPAREILARLADDRVRARQELVFEVETFFARYAANPGDEGEVTVAVWEQTDFTLAPIPFGGFVQINGMLVQDDIDLADQRAYPNRPTWQRIATIFAGPATNYLFAIFIAISLYSMAGVEGKTAHFEILGAMAGYDAEGKLLAGDIVLAVDGKDFSWGKKGPAKSLVDAVEKAKKQPMVLRVRRDDKELEVVVTPRYVPGELEELFQSEIPSIRRLGEIAALTPWFTAPRYLLGVSLHVQLERVHAGIVGTIRAALVYPVVQTKNILGGLWLLLKSQLGLTKQKVQGEARSIVGIAEVITRSFERGLVETLSLLMLLNVYLGLFNLLPLPALDGGRLVFLAYEMATRRRANQKVEQTVHMIGFMALSLLLVVVTYKDIVRLFQ